MSDHSHLRLPIWIAVLFVTSPGIPAAEPEDAMPVDDLPLLVRKELKQKWPVLAIVSARKDERNDYVHFHVLLRGKTEERKVEILENGTVVKTEPIISRKRQAASHSNHP